MRTTTYLLATTVALWAAATPAAAQQGFQFPGLNRSYSLENPEVPPIRQGPVTVRLASPKNVVIVQGHQLQLTPRPDGTYDATLAIDFLGKGDLVADLETDTGTKSRLADSLILPRQRLEVSGRVRFAKVAGGYDVTALSLPDAVVVNVQSKLTNDIVNVCNSLAILVPLDCPGLEGSLTRIRVPMPPAGSVFFLSAEDLAGPELALLEKFLAK